MQIKEKIVFCDTDKFEIDVSQVSNITVFSLQRIWNL